MRSLDDELSLVVDRVEDADAVLLFGVGKSYEVARLAASLLRTVGVCAVGVHATDVLHGDLNFLPQAAYGATVAIGISHSGRTQEVLTALKAAAGRSAHTVLISSRDDADGLEYVNQWLGYFMGDQDGSRHGTIPTRSVTLQLAWVNQVVCALADKLSVEDLHSAHTEGALDLVYAKKELDG